MEFHSILLFASGALLIGAGALFSTNVSKKWKSSFVNKNAKRHAAIYALLGIILVGFGGFLTAYGWKVFDNRADKKAIITSVAKEWIFNQSLFDLNPLLQGDSASLRGYEFYPRFSDQSIRFALMSSLFDLSDSLDKRLFIILWKSERVIYVTNSRLQVTDNYSLITPDRESVAERRLHVIESKGLQWFVNNQATLGEFLKSNYPWAFSRSNI